GNDLLIGDNFSDSASNTEKTLFADFIADVSDKIKSSGSSGNDTLVGYAGNDVMAGGGGNDKLYGDDPDNGKLGLTPGNDILFGDAGNDPLIGGGGTDQLYGGAGADVFELANGTFVMDADTTDHASWGPFLLTGGVQQWWMEDGWAYYTPL